MGSIAARALETQDQILFSCHVKGLFLLQFFIFTPSFTTGYIILFPVCLTSPNLFVGFISKKNIYFCDYIFKWSTNISPIFVELLLLRLFILLSLLWSLCASRSETTSIGTIVVLCGLAQKSPESFFHIQTLFATHTNIYMYSQLPRNLEQVSGILQLRLSRASIFFQITRSLHVSRLHFYLF